MRIIIIGIGLVALATLGYFALSTSTTKSPAPTATTTSEGAQDSEPNSSKLDSDRFVTPRRMRSNSALSKDELSDDSRRRIKQMGRGIDATKLRANRGSGLEGSDEIREDDRSAREAARAEVVLRRTKQWIVDADKNSDGLLSPSEAELGGAHLRLVLADFGSADSDGDGLINEEELQAASLARRAKRQERRGGR
jgi:hypothetical protein